MNGAEILVKTLIDNNVEVCFANPGPSEIHLVAAIKNSEKIRPVLALVEGVATGAADGYGRMAGKPAITMLHLGVGLMNGSTNLHNAKRAKTPLLNIVGDHPDTHLHYDAPLTTDIRAIAAHTSDCVYRVSNIRTLGSDTARALQATAENNGQVATLILPANVAWEEGAVPASTLPKKQKAQVDEQIVKQVRDAFKKRTRIALLLRDEALKDNGLRRAGKIAEATGARLFSDTFYPRIQRGAGYPMVTRLPYHTEDALAVLKEIDVLILVGAQPPISFFAYPGGSSSSLPATCKVITLSHPHEDGPAALEVLCSLLNVHEGNKGLITKLALPDLPKEGPLTPEGAMRIIGRLLPPQTVICDESISSGLPYYALTAAVQPHDMLQLTGGSIGCMLSASIGAAIACPDRKVLCLVGDGSAMYTIQALWTMARENLDITIVVYSNRNYAFLEQEMELMHVVTKKVKKPPMLYLGDPDLNWIKLSQSMGIEAAQAETTKEFYALFKTAMSGKRPFLIEAMI
ncbi:acetolactate synthase large subunit [Pedobacter hartonius]|uniref:Acetolactate synthase-1/2/3 large subunit n=1 Tax=Pedobacter hartonius TaxID=425514 RepID=A0A1H3XDW7_9SPHI|nr:acetolactate synthase large subunit [Pedobacter hartonius]SDZ96802.1 acetolactate synthase-1/2/3 large subunit [Pedobacter hartonius]